LQPGATAIPQNLSVYPIQQQPHFQLPEEKEEKEKNEKEKRKRKKEKSQTTEHCCFQFTTGTL